MHALVLLSFAWCTWGKWQSPGMFWVRGLLSWAVGQLHFLHQALGCYASMTWSPGLHRGYTGCHRCRWRGNLWNSWHGGNSCGLWFQSCRHCRSNRWRLHQLCRLGGCRLWCRDVRSGRSLHCGCCGVLWWELSINCCSLECQEGELWISTAVLSTLECMLNWFHTCLCKSIWLWIVQALGLMGDTPRIAEISKLGTCILRTIVRVKDFWDSMLWEHFLEQWDDFDSVVLTRWKTLDEDHLWVEVTTYEVVDSFQGKDVSGTHLPWVGWSWCRCEGCCSILGLEPGVGLTLMNNFLHGFVYAGPEDTSTHEQLGFGDSLMELV